MGDCDCTYDFREITPFVEKFRAGAEFIMGSRFDGYIEPGSMPPLHRYFGTPISVFVYNTAVLVLSSLGLLGLLQWILRRQLEVRRS